MFKLFSLASVAALGAATVAAEDSCVLVDFTAETSQFADLNAAIDLVVSANVISSLLSKYDPLTLEDIALGNFSYSILGQDLTITPTIDSLNITGLSSILPEHVNATSTNCVDLGAYSNGEISVDGSLTVELKELDASATAQVTVVLEKPTLAANVQVNMYACAPSVSSSQCSNMTVMGLETQIVSLTAGGDYSSILNNLLLKFKDAAVQSFTLDFAKVTTFDISFDSSSSTLSSITDMLSGYSADEINKKGDVYKTLISTINDQVPSLLNDLIDSKLQPLFGATCLTEN
ncbi:hypothetical protein BBJ28_00024233 [Nothophytophthora sp. Chile5]|nr:hypothetical protein BBJ28_00024233 [Nothophytophthora sp. Chile5]